MGVLQRFERRLEGLVGTAFARIFKGQVEPVEVAKALQREAEDRRAIVGAGRTLVPNRYVVELGRSDYERLSPWEAQLTNTFAEMVQEYVDDEGWGAFGDVEVRLTCADELVTGVFRIASSVDPDVPPRQRPANALSTPSAPALYGQPDFSGRDHNNQGGSAGYGAPPDYGQHGGYAEPGYGQPDPYAQDPYGQPGGYGQPDAGYGQGDYGGHGGPGGPGGPGYGAPPASDYGQPGYGAPQGGGYPQESPRHWISIDGSDRNYELQMGANVIGRGQDADLRLPDTGVSRRHAEVRFDGHSAVLHDMGSTNGTTVNGQQVQSWQLQHGDVIRLGHSTLVYRQDYA